MSEEEFIPSEVEPLEVATLEDSTQETADTQQETPQVEPEPSPVQADPEQLARESNTYKNLQADYTRKAQENSELRNRLDSMEQRLDKPTPPPSQDNSDLDKMTKDFEELKPVADSMRQMRSDMREQQKVLSQQRQAQEYQHQQMQEAHFWSSVEQAHSDVHQLIASPEFNQWVDGQPPQLRSMKTSNSPEDAVYLLNLYKGNNKVAQAQMASAPKSGSAPKHTTSSNRLTPVSHYTKMTDTQFAKVQNEYDSKAQEGLIDWAS